MPLQEFTCWSPNCKNKVLRCTTYVPPYCKECNIKRYKLAKEGKLTYKVPKRLREKYRKIPVNVQGIIIPTQVKFTHHENGSLSLSLAEAEYLRNYLFSVLEPYETDTTD